MWRAVSDIDVCMNPVSSEVKEKYKVRILLNTKGLNSCYQVTEAMRDETIQYYTKHTLPGSSPGPWIKETVDES